MAAITSAVLGGAAAIASAAQAIDQNRKMKQAQASAKSLANEAKNLKMENAYAGLQVSDKGEKLAMNQGAASDASALSAIQGAGAEAVIGATGQLVQGQSERDLAIGAQLGDKETQRNLAVAGGQQEANLYNFNKDSELINSQLQGAQGAAAQAQANKNSAIEGIFGGISSGISAIGNTDKFDYSKLNTEQQKVYNTVKDNPDLLKTFLGQLNKPQ